MLRLTADSRLDIAASGARHGFGIFETILVRDGRIPLLDLHVARLGRGTAFLGLGAPPDVEAIRRFLEDETDMADIAEGMLHLRAVDGSVIVSLSTCLPTTPDRVRIGLSQKIRRISSNPCNGFKTLSYLDNSLIALEAEGSSCLDLIALNERGALTDGGRTNLFIVKESSILTPRAQDGPLPGIARGILLDAGIAEEAELLPHDLETCESVFLTNALRGVVPVHSACGREKNPLHPLLEAAERAYRSAVRSAP